MRNKLFLTVICILLSRLAYAQANKTNDLMDEMEAIPLFSAHTEENVATNETLRQLEKEDFMHEIRLLDWALSQQGTGAYDSLRSNGYFSFLSGIKNNGESNYVTYCLCYKHRAENFSLASKDSSFVKFRELYDSGFFQPSKCGCATLDYVPTSAVRDAAYYLKIIDKVFKTQGEKLAKYKWTPATYKIWESKQKNDSKASLANTRKTFLYYISQTYSITYD